MISFNGLWRDESKLRLYIGQLFGLSSRNALVCATANETVAATNVKLSAAEFNADKIGVFKLSSHYIVFHSFLPSSMIP